MISGAMRPLLCLSLLLLSLSAHAGQPTWVWNSPEMARIKQLSTLVKAEGGFYIVDTGVWNVRTDISAMFAIELTCFLELFEKQFLEVTQIKRDPQVKARLSAKVFAKEADYRALFNDGSRGYFRWKYENTDNFTEFTLYSFAEKPEEREFKAFYHPILLHEGTHMMLQRFAGTNKLPVFLNEGLATYFQFWNLRKNLGENLLQRKNSSFFRKLILERVRSDKTYAPDLAALFKMADKDWNTDKMGPLAKFNYAQGEAFIEALATDPAMRGILPPLLANALEGKDALDPKDTPRINALWNAGLRRP